MAISDNLLEGKLTFKTYLDGGQGGQNLKILGRTSFMDGLLIYAITSLKNCYFFFGVNYYYHPQDFEKLGVQRGQSYLMERKCLFSLGWPPF